jgi:hypothetical protein
MSTESLLGTRRTLTHQTVLGLASAFRGLALRLCNDNPKPAFYWSRR